MIDIPRVVQPNEGRKNNLPEFPFGMAKIAFRRDNTVCIYDARTKAVREIAEGYDPELSPSGDIVSFTVNTNDLTTTLKKFDLQSATVDEFRPLATLNVRNARWSHDGRKIAFNVIVDRQTHVGVLDLSTGRWDDITTRFPFVEHGEFRGGAYFNSWSPDDNSVICHDLYAMYEIALDGRMLSRIPFEQFIPGVEVTSALQFEFSSDRKFILIDSSRNPEHSNFYAFNLQDHQLRRLTADIDGFESRWLPSQDAILFSRGKIYDPDDTSDLCVMSLKDGKLTTIIKNAESGSYSTR
jgi:hypothetical protein